LVLGHGCSRCTKRRPGVSIVEVLFAILITTVGLFGAIAVFPFASAQARRSRIYDMMAVAGRSSFHDFDARGMRRPDMWIAWNESTNQFMPAFTVATQLESFCIDPRMIAAHTNYISGSPQLHPTLAPDPVNLGTLSSPGGRCVQNFPYAAVGTSGAVPGAMRRITLRQTGNSAVLTSYNTPMSRQQADAIFRIDDDLSYNRPEEDKSLPATQVVSSLPNAPVNAWGRRQADGQISWLATVVPKIDISGVRSDEYTLSLVMLFERANDLERVDYIPPTPPNPWPLRERMIEGEWQGPGITGGEILLEAPGEDQLKLKPNDWVMVSGIYNVGGTPVARYQWYRVSDCDMDAESNASHGHYHKYATLIGQDWNMNFNRLNANVGQVYVTIIEGAFAVYEKTIRLDYGSTY
jgi:hypothetical protein